MERDDVELTVACAPARPGAILPERMTPGSSGFDLHACLETPVELEAGAWSVVPTGLILAIPEGYEGVVRARSGLAARHGVGLPNGPGTIDSDYRGELGVILMNWGKDRFLIRPGDRIAQIVFQRVPRARVAWTEELPESARGAGGFGHTGTRPAEERR
jgi:dUTP pyrophosphatase